VKNKADASGMNVFDDMDKYWAEIADRNSTQKQVEFVKEKLKAKGWILDLACGTGRHSVLLSIEGYDMVGLDLSLNLLKIARNRGSNIQVVMGDMRFLPFKTKALSAAISLDTSFDYLPSEQDDLQSLRTLRDTLLQDSLFIVDVFNREQLILKYKNRRAAKLKWAFLPALLKPNRLIRWTLFRLYKWKEYPSFFLLQKRTISTNCSTLNDLWVICDKHQGQTRVFQHNVRLYEPKQLQLLFEKAGFTINRIYGDYDNQPFDPNSYRLIFLVSAK
jgi:SAM-dependent methyltransferase